MGSPAALDRLARVGSAAFQIGAVVVVGLTLAAASLWQPVPVLGLAFGGFGLVASVLWAARRPRAALGFAAVLVLIAGTKFRLRDPTLSASGAVDAQILFELGVFAVISAIALVVRRTARAEVDGTTWVELSLLAFAALALVSALWSPIPKLSLVRAGQMIVLVLLAVVMHRSLGPLRAILALHTALLGYVLACSAIAIIAPWTSHTLTHHGLDRFTWFAMHPIGVATLTGLAGTFVIARALFFPPGDRRLLGLSLWLWLVPVLAILASTRSRAAVVALAISAAALAVRRFTPSWTAAGFLCVSIGVLALFPIVDLSALEILERWRGTEGALAEFVFRGQTPQEVMTLNGRLELWGALSGVIADRPLIGHGYLSTREIMIGLVSWAQLGGYAHNELMQTLLDLGFIGAVLFWAPFLSGFLTGPLRHPGTDRRIAGARAMVFGAATFLLANAMTSEGLVAPPGFGMLTVCVLSVTAARLRRFSDAAGDSGDSRAQAENVGDKSRLHA